MLIILDRDGVINEDSDAYIKSPAEWHALPGSLEAIAQLNCAGHKVVVATNQSGVGRGYFSVEVLKQIHQKMADELAKVNGYIAGIYYCPHIPEDQCSCRKPKPGLLQQIAAAYPSEFSTAVLIGDSWRDIEAAHAVNCNAILVQTGKGIVGLSKQPALKEVPVFRDLAEAVTALLSEKLILT